MEISGRKKNCIYFAVVPPFYHIDMEYNKTCQYTETLEGYSSSVFTFLRLHNGGRKKRFLKMLNYLNSSGKNTVLRTATIAQTVIWLPLHNNWNFLEVTFNWKCVEMTFWNFNEIERQCVLNLTTDQIIFLK